MLTREQKTQVIQTLARELQDSRGVVFCDFQGLPARALQSLRSQLRKEQVQYRAVKLTLLKRALREIGVDVSTFDFQVPLSVSFSAEDEVAPARLLLGFAKKHDKLKVLGGVLDKKLLNAAEVQKLGSLPGKFELRGQLVGVIARPLSGLVSVLVGNLRGFINVISAIQKAKS